MRDRHNPTNIPVADMTEEELDRIFRLEIARLVDLVAQAKPARREKQAQGDREDRKWR